jgi:hypothetical protein
MKWGDHEADRKSERKSTIIKPPKDMDIEVGLPTNCDR